MNGLSMKLFPSRTLAVLAVAVVAWSAPARAEGDNGVRWTNGLPTPALRFNALSANPRANPQMVAQPLRTETYALGTGSPDLRDQMEDSSAREFMKYVVSCALAPGQGVEWMDRAGNAYQFEGRMGLCPEWNTGSASLECQRWVSACVLARNNAEGKRVLFSGRGNRPVDPVPFTPKPEVETDPYFRFTQTKVESMQDCATTELGIHRDCGFKVERVGQCVPGTRVHVGGGGVAMDFPCGSSPLGATLEGTQMLRVCEGVTACNEAGALAQSAVTCSLYLPAMSFTCPASGVFSVMSGSYSSAETGKVQVGTLNAAYPASEEQLFTFREGGFYGRLFGPGALAPGVDVHVDSAGVVHKDVSNIHVAGSIYPKMFVCQDPGWTRADAYANERLCTLPGENCVALPVGRCNATVSAGSYSGPRCQLDNAAGLREYSRCVDPAGVVFPEVVTSLLSKPCDIVSDPYACAREGGTVPGGTP